LPFRIVGVLGRQPFVDLADHAVFLGGILRIAFHRVHVAERYVAVILPMDLAGFLGGQTFENLERGALFAYGPSRIALKGRDLRQSHTLRREKS
jgi:hypothetical protein